MPKQLVTVLDSGHDSPSDLPELTARAGSQGHALHAGLGEHQSPGVECRLAPVAHHQNPAVPLDHLTISVQVDIGQVLQDDVEAISVQRSGQGFAFVAFFSMIEGDIGPASTDQLHALFSARRADDMSANGLGQLTGGRANGSRCAVNQ